MGRKARIEGVNYEETRKRPARNPQAREQQMISYAVDLAEKQLIEGTASSQVITHFLKLGASNYELELEKQRKEISLLEAKVKALESAQHTEALTEAAINAMRLYQGKGFTDYKD